VSIRSVRVNIDRSKIEQLLGIKRVEAKGTVTVVGNGSSNVFQVEVRHGLNTDKLVVSVSSTKPLSATPSYLYGYLVDRDGDGFRETVVVCVRFDTAPADGELVEIYWKAESVEQ